MMLYSTVLHIHDYPVPYRVSLQDGNKFLLFTPQHPLPSDIESPIFWVAKKDNAWTPINIQDPALHQQVLDDIRAHLVE